MSVPGGAGTGADAPPGAAAARRTYLEELPVALTPESAPAPLRPAPGRLRRAVCAVGLAITAVFAGLAVPAAPAVALPVSAPALDRDFPDPDVVKVGSTYYAYATESGGNTVQRARSSDLRSWTYLNGSALTLPAWAQAGRTWAPEVFQRGDGRMVMWFTAWDRASGKQCIGVATAAGPEQTFTPTSSTPAICPTSIGGAIDAASFLDTNGQRYILWKNDGNCCAQDTWLWIRPVAADGITLTGSASQLVRQDLDFEGNLVEAPTMWKVGSTYVLFYSANFYGNGSYLTSYARSSSPTGGFTKAPAPLMTTDNFRGIVVGPGGQDVVTGTDGKPKIVFHGWRNGTSYRAMYVQDLGFANGYPVVAGCVVKYEAEHGTVNHAYVRSGAAGASNGQVVAGMDFGDSWVEVRSIYVPRGGTITLRLRYAAGAGNATDWVDVDGTPVSTISLPNTGWDNWQYAYKDVSVGEGFHTVRFTRNAAYAELDRLDVY